jgi:hypothetical protein
MLWRSLYADLVHHDHPGEHPPPCQNTCFLTCFLMLSHTCFLTQFAAVWSCGHTAMARQAVVRSCVHSLLPSMITCHTSYLPAYLLLKYNSCCWSQVLLCTSGIQARPVKLHHADAYKPDSRQCEAGHSVSHGACWSPGCPGVAGHRAILGLLEGVTLC